MNLEVQIGEVRLRSPLIGASGLFGYGDEYRGVVDLERFGAVVTKTVTLAPREGNAPPRIYDSASGIINSIGLENVGLDAFVRERLAGLEIPCRLFVSIGGAAEDEYRSLAGLLTDVEGIDAVEVNISCPNVEKGGIAFGRDPESTRRVIAAVRQETELTLLAKLPPLVSGIEEVCQAACEAGADALVIANTYPAIAIDIQREVPVLGGVSGGLSGGAIKPITLLLVWKIARIVDAPIIGVGGIETARDAVEYILAGASAFQVGSIVLRDSKAPSHIVDGMESFMQAKGYKSLLDFKGNASRQEEPGGKREDSRDNRS
jgi:dihydroorotate dehydrogenase (NAD+) catalytic subunit